MEKISAVIITKNEAKNIARCLESIKWADEILVLDNSSTDETVDICRQYNCTVHINETWEGFGKAKHKAVELSKYDWIFSIDADEQVSDELRTKIQEILEQPDPNIAFRIKRISFYLGKQIRYSGWQRDFTLRLFNRNTGNFNLKIIHEFVEVKGEIRTINEQLNHYSFPDLKTHINKMTHYSELFAEQSFQKNKKTSIFYAIIDGIGKFFKMYIFNLGFLDGKEGLILALNSAFGVYLKYLYLWEKNNKLL
jgi:glycosyltransferase involved in cell wall biosynthesis